MLIACKGITVSSCIITHLEAKEYQRINLIKCKFHFGIFELKSNSNIHKLVWRLSKFAFLCAGFGWRTFIFYKRFRGNMIIDVTGIILTPGNYGKDCLGNGKNIDENGQTQLCCDECDYMICCFSDDWESRCKQCKKSECPRSNKN